MKPQQSASLHNEVAAAKQNFVANAIPIDPLNFVRRRPWTSTIAVASVTMVAGALSGGPMVRLLTTGWLSKVMILGVDWARKYAMPMAQGFAQGAGNGAAHTASTSAASPEKHHAVG